MNKVYIAGPMRGYPNFNFPAFFAAADYFKNVCGWQVFNPAQDDWDTYGVDVSKGNDTGCELQAEEEHGVTIRDCMQRDCEWICKHATHMYMLRGWENSSGALAEHALAKALGDVTFMYEQG